MTFIRANLLPAPFMSDSVDLAYSFGVVHHTPVSFRSFQAVRAALEVGGYLAVYVYVVPPARTPRHAWDRAREFRVPLDALPARALTPRAGAVVEESGMDVIASTEFVSVSGRANEMRAAFRRLAQFSGDRA